MGGCGGWVVFRKVIVWETQVVVGRTGRAGEGLVGGSVWGGGGAAAGEAWEGMWKRLWDGGGGGKLEVGRLQESDSGRPKLPNWG